MADSGKLTDITERAFAFAVRIVKFSKLLHAESRVARPIIDQLLRGYFDRSKSGRGCCGTKYLGFSA